MTGSPRAAAVASIIYAANPMFLFWSAQFAYESLGLPLAAFTVWWIYTTRKARVARLQIVTVLAIGAITVTHHISAFALTGNIGNVVPCGTDRAEAGEHRRSVGAFTLLAGSYSTLWFFFVARPAARYLIGDNIRPTMQETIKLIGGHAGRQLYSGGGPVPPRGTRCWPYAAIVVIMLALLPALYRVSEFVCVLWQGEVEHIQDASLAVAAIISISFPFTLLPRLTSVGGPISARTSEYVFMGLGCTLGILAAEPAVSPFRSSNSFIAR